MKNKTFIFDIVMLVLYVAVELPAVTGVAAHEWAGLALLVVFIIHMSFHVDQEFGIVRRFIRSRRKNRGGAAAGADSPVVVDGASGTDQSAVFETSSDAASPAADNVQETSSEQADALSQGDQESDSYARSAAGIWRVILDIALLIALVLCVVSGLMVSGTVLPLFGIYVPDGYYFWHPLHSASATILLALILVHVVVNGQWIINRIRKKRHNS